MLLCVFMVADTDVLGKRFEHFVKPATDRMRNRRRTEYWIMASVFRDVLVLWIVYCMRLNHHQVFRPFPEAPRLHTNLGCSSRVAYPS